MSINQNLFVHESDKKAMAALKAIPGFDQLVKSFMSVFSEKQFRVTNMSSNVRISEKQLPKYHNMLLEICKKLEIEVPEMYLELNVYPNAYTAGDEHPFIVLTSGLIETVPEELIPTVIAHECGHIVCHHTLYLSMGMMLINGALALLPVPELAITSLKAAFAYWMRCSEFSADRASIICDGTADKTAELCARLAGFDKDLNEPINMEEFMNQAIEYREMVKTDAWNKTLELILIMNNSHPLNAVRAYEAVEWTKTEQFRNVDSIIRGTNKELKLTVWNSRFFESKVFEEVEAIIKSEGFINVVPERVTDKPGLFTKPGQVLKVEINGNRLEEDVWVNVNDKITIAYYLPLTEEEIKAMHPGEIKLLYSNKYYIGKNYQEVMNEFINAGFVNVTVRPVKDIVKENDRNIGKVSLITINSQAVFNKGDWFKETEAVEIVYREKI